jgi:hypothetical protein
MEKEITPQQALIHLASLALEAPASDKVHTMSKKCFEVIKKLIEEKKEI